MNKKVILTLLVICMLVSNMAYASEKDNEIVETNAERMEEVVDLRDATSKTYKMSDGSMQWVGYSDDIHYKTAGNEFLEIDNTIKTSEKTLNGIKSKYQNTSNSFDVMFADIDKSNHHITIEKDIYSVALGWKGETTTPATKIMSLRNNLLNDVINKDNSVIYSDVTNGVDLIYELSTHGFKEYIVLKSKPETNIFEFSLKLEGLKPYTDEDGNVTFINEKDEKIFDIANLFAVDANEKYTENVICKVVNDGNDYLLEVILDNKYLEESSRAYPILIDPSIVISSAATLDSFVGSKSPNTNYNRGTNMPYLRTGRDSDYYTRRSYLKFDIPSSIKPNTVTSAYLTMSKSSGANPSIRAHRVTGSWGSNTITWNNKPGFTDTDRSANAYSFTQYGKSSWYKMNVTNIVKSWVNKNHGNYGFMVKDNTESGTSQWTTFYSSDAASPDKPELIINYMANPKGYAYSVGTNDGGDDFTPNVRYAKTMYDTLLTIDGSYLSTSPTVTYLKGNNPNGNRRIGSSVVFLNGHANPNTIYLGDTGVTRGTDTPKYAGLSSTNMANTTLISFVGCSTGYGPQNLPQTAVSRGATSALGFTDEIHSRRADGIAWLRRYNDNLSFGTGATVASAVANASLHNPTSTLAKHAKIFGNSTAKITTLSSGTKATTNEAQPNFIALDASFNIDDIDTQGVLSTIKSLKPDFDPEKYEATRVNLSDDFSYVLFNYYIKGSIQTNKAFVIIFEDGYASKMLFQDKDHLIKDNMIEEELLNKVNNHQKQVQKNDVKMDMTNVVDYSDRYVYYFDEEKLVYEISVIREQKMGDGAVAYADETIQTIIN